MQIEEFKKNCEEIVKAIGNIFVGDEPALRKILCASLVNGHVLFEDYPGLGKTLLTKIFAKVIGCNWKRIQFTPDLLPADIIGTRVWLSKKSEFSLEKGPIFTNVLLADEINRATPKTQSALLESMEERQVTIEGTLHRLESPFFVIATQNPLEMEGTYPLPEAQIDRFLIKLSLGYVDSIEEETKILKRRIEWKTDDPAEDIESVVTQKTFKKMQKEVENSVFVHENILNYITEIVRKTRTHSKVEVGASPRGGLALLKLSRAMALSRGRDFVTPDDVKDFAYDALTHRIILTSEQMLEGVDSEKIVEEAISEVKAPKEYKPG
ncbi:magnesium chelatase [candidate division MSBL1 archaeon SCGC-AAA259B11]|uniref:Magnesium chelatase n=1 Tax=candidate division MSBL1 archaeon SCGC-AAA259B11 TaxID=1698260 RepID=A0A133U3Q9_9EURY|nr:magnesium chelatase [candidate division MSBL1 archaeon SCGC-AAA259B11]